MESCPASVGSERDDYNHCYVDYQTYESNRYNQEHDQVVVTAHHLDTTILYYVKEQVYKL